MLIPKQLPTSKVLLLVGIVVVALGVSAYLLYFNFYADSNLSTTVSSVIDRTVGSEDLFKQPITLPQVSGFDSDFFSDPFIKLLKSYGQVPNITPGKADPFAPLPGGTVTSRR